jgi:hypothetical protein
MTSPETLHMKNVANELSFPLVTHTTHLDIRFGCYGILKSCFSSGHVMDRLDCSCSVRCLGHKMGDTWRVRIQHLKETVSAFWRLLKHTFTITVAMVMTIWTQPRAEFTAYWNSAEGGLEGLPRVWIKKLTSITFALLSLLIRWLDDATRPNRPHQGKEMVAKDLDKLFYRSNET